MAGILTGAERDAARIGHVRAGTVEQRTLVAGLLKLKWTLWKRSYRKNVGKLIGTIIGSLYGLGGLVGMTFALVALVFVDGEGGLFAAVVRGVGILATLLWLVVPVFAFGLDDTLDPRAFAIYPRTPRELQPGMFLAALLSLPTLFTVVAALLFSVFEGIFLVLHGAGAVPTVLGLVLLVPANLAGIALCVLLPRAILAHSAGRASSRRGREIGSILGMVVLIGGLYGFSLFAQSINGASIEVIGRKLLEAVGVLSWTPLGALFSVPVDLASGDYLPALVRLVIGAASIVGLWLWWRSSLGAALTSALIGDSSSGTTAEKPLVPRFAPRNALGASIGRSLRYWRRDSRYIAAIAVMPLMLVFFVAMGMLGPAGPFMGILGLLLIAGMGGISLMNEIGFDGPSGWVTMTAGLPSRPNLAGRVIALALFAVPFIAIASIAVPLLLGRGELIAMMLPGTLGLLLSGLGVSVLISVLLPYPTAPPGTNPMKDKSSSTSNAMIAMAVGMIGIWIPQIPAIGVGIWGAVVGSLGLQILAGAIALIAGIITIVVGIRVAASILDRRMVDLFQKVRAFL
ncbi:hypothetical protein [Brachybacterium hainanense]|uniref:ABC-2 type transport system permease protein n=1 Tax=Brachybacterium hainanense TaxID=1541174 RepID=A0ABV6R7U4_9MICO